ncbi:MAG: DUF3179 domain-containing protein [Calditrichaeota bacterium]|nr:MAG: DUF3179 domain-containing protein [Calditrichota bacterium]MBL1205261.1 DUF3179 domain-containing protein [Calditrichota bacterium]NOG45090.1 DUF3179 domain-containing protein [Calditrichota bacterium]
MIRLIQIMTLTFLSSINLCAQESENLKLMMSLLNPDEDAQLTAAIALAEKHDISLAAAFIDVLYFKKLSDESFEQLKKLTHRRFDKKWPKWMEWLGQQDIKNSLDYMNFKRFMLSTVDPQFSSFLNPRFPSHIRWDEIVWGGAEKDGIPALDNPLMIKAEAASYVDDNESVFGLAVNGEFHAYPLRIFNWHEMINIEIGGKSVSISYCTLCGAAIPFDTKVDGRVFTFGSSGLLYRSNKLMYDRQTNSLWSAFEGKPVTGLMAQQDVKLKTYPIVRTSWQEWKTKHPKTLVLDINTGHTRNYGRFGGPYNAYFRSPRTMFPISWRDYKLEAKEWVYGIHVKGKSKAYPIKLFEENQLIQDSFGGINFVFIGNEDELTVRVYQAEDQYFSMTMEGVLKDQSGKNWKVYEDSLVTDDHSKKLNRYPGHLAYWFAWYQFFMDTDVYEARENN